MHALACMIVNFSGCWKTDQKISGSAAPADGILAAHCRPNGNSAPPFKRQLWTKYIAPRGRWSHM